MQLAVIRYGGVEDRIRGILEREFESARTINLTGEAFVTVHFQAGRPVKYHSGWRQGTVQGAGLVRDLLEAAAACESLLNSMKNRSAFGNATVHMDFLQGVCCGVRSSMMSSETA